MRKALFEVTALVGEPVSWAQFDERYVPIWVMAGK